MSAATLSREATPRRTLTWAPYLTLIGVVIGFGPLVSLYLKQLWALPHYQFFPLLLSAVALLIWLRWPQSDEPAKASPKLSRLCLWTALGVLSGAVLLFSPWLAAVGALFAMAGVLLQFAGRAFWAKFFSAWVLLWLLVRPPFGLDLRLIEWLQTSTSQAASAVLDQLGILHLLAGNVIEFADQRLFVEEACSGIQSLYALMSCAALLVVWTRRPAVSGLLLVASAVFWAALLNVVRVTSIAAMLAWWEIDLSSGWRHDALGFFLFGCAFLMLMSTDRFIWFVSSWFNALWKRFRNRRRRRRDLRIRFRSRRSGASTRTPSRNKNGGRTSTHPQPRPVGWWSSAIFTGAFGCLAALQVLALVAPRDEKVRLSAYTANLDQGALPAEQNGWKLVDYNTRERDLRSEFGQHSKVWSYEAPFCQTRISFDYPFEGWHELTRCYRSQGWNVMKRSIKTPGKQERSAASLGAQMVEVEMTKPTGEQGYLLFVLFDEAGRPVKPPATDISLTSKFYAKIAHSPLFQWLRERRLADADTSAVTYQMQAFVSTDFRLSPTQREEVHNQFLALNRQFTGLWENP